MAWRMLGLVALGELLGMTLWFSATAVTPTLVAELSLDAGQAAWLTMAVQAGFVSGTLLSALLNLPDVMNARWLFVLGCCAGAATNATVAWSTDPNLVITWRFATGLALAGVYPPGLKIAAGWFAHRRGTALGILIGALTIGSSVPHLLTWLPTDLPWRQVVRLSSLFAVAGGVLVAVAVRDGPHVPHSAPFDPRAALAVFVNRGTRLATLGYLGHMWELYAMWAWIGVFLYASFGLLMEPEQAALSAAFATFAIVAAGAVGCVAGGLIADRLGRTAVTSAMMAVSGTCAAIVGFLFGGPPALLIAVCLVWGFTIVADSAQFSASTAELSDPSLVGTMLTVQTSMGFLLTLATIHLVPVLVDAVGWRYAFAFLAPGPALGIWAMMTLRRHPDSVWLASGKR